MALSFWAWVIDPKLAAILSVAGGLAGQIVAAVSVRRGVDLKSLAPFVLGASRRIPLGVLLLPSLDADRSSSSRPCSASC